MSRMPAHIVAVDAGGKLPGRRGVWAAIRGMGTFTQLELRLAVPHVKPHVVHDYLGALVRGGYVAPGTMIAGPTLGGGKVRAYALVKDTGVDAPRLRKDGSELPPTGQQLMWEAMRILGSFTAGDLAMAASTESVAVPAETAELYIRHLHGAGYLVSDGGLHRLIQDTGGLAPMVQRTKVVFDPNLGEVMWHEDMEP